MSSILLLALIVAAIGGSLVSAVLIAFGIGTKSQAIKFAFLVSFVVSFIFIVGGSFID